MNLKDELDDRRKELDKKEEEVNLKWERFKSKKITYFKNSKKKANLVFCPRNRTIKSCGLVIKFTLQII